MQRKILIDGRWSTKRWKKRKTQDTSSFPLLEELGKHNLVEQTHWRGDLESSLIGQLKFAANFWQSLHFLQALTCENPANSRANSYPHAKFYLYILCIWCFSFQKQLCSLDVKNLRTEIKLGSWESTHFYTYWFSLCIVRHTVILNLYNTFFLIHYSGQLTSFSHLQLGFFESNLCRLTLAWSCRYVSSFTLEVEVGNCKNPQSVIIWEKS